MVNFLLHNKCTHKEAQHLSIAILHSNLDYAMLDKYYFHALTDYTDDFICFNLHKQKKRTPATEQKEYLKQLEQFLEPTNVKYILCCDAEYFKTLTGVTKTDSYLYYALDSKCKKYKVVYCPTYKNVFYNPKEVTDKINRCLNVFVSLVQGTYQDLGISIIDKYEFIHCDEYNKATKALESLIQLNQPISADIEAFSLKHFDAGIGTICFCTDESNGIVIACDLKKDSTRFYNKTMRKVLKHFFKKFNNKIIWHNCGYDITVLVYQLFMNSLDDVEGMNKGIKILTKNIDDTKIISYLALNSTNRPSLSLKSLAHEYSGNYAVEEINDITKIPYEELMEYNLIDGLSTHYVYNKYYPIMVQDNQEHLYLTLFKDSLVDIINMQLNGLPIKMNQVKQTHKELSKQLKTYLDNMNNSYLITTFNDYLKEQEVEEYNTTRIKKRITIDDATASFNPNSNPQLTALLYNQQFMNLPIIDKTDKGNPSTGSKTLEKLINHTTNQKFKDFLENLIEYNKLNKILTAFFPAFLNAKECNGQHYLFGSFNLGGTVSGRLSSSNINLQNLPSTQSKYAKVVKQCFGFNKDEWLFIGADFNALEDRIICLLTGDPVRRSIYLDGFDAHCRNSYAYYTEQMPDIEFANSNQKCYKANVNGTYFYFKEDEKIIYQGKEFIGKELYEHITN